MPKNNSDGGYRLPDVIDPEESICVTVRVPNDLMHLIAFWGALEELARWWNWERDALKRGREAAAVWRAVIDEARANTVYGECSGGNVQVRQRPGEPCKLDVDYGSGWQQFADLRLCAPEVTVQPDGGINIGGTTIYPNAPLGVDPETGFPIQPAPAPQPSLTPCAAAISLGRILAQTHEELCAKIQLSDLAKALAALAIFAAVWTFPPNLVWALPLVAGFATINTVCESSLAGYWLQQFVCIAQNHIQIVDDQPQVDRTALLNALNDDGRAPLLIFAYLISNIDTTGLNAAAAVGAATAGQCPPCGPRFTVMVLSSSFYPDANLGSDLMRSRWWSTPGYVAAEGVHRVSLRFDNVNAVQGLPSIGCRIRAWNSATTFNSTTYSLFYVDYLRFRRVSTSTGANVSAPAQLRIWRSFDANDMYTVTQTGEVTIRDVRCAQISTNAGTNGFNNNGEAWVIDLRVRTGTGSGSLRWSNSLGQEVNWTNP
jgi:hypothetical protein